jgi:steroid delta-isomerase-like uncharacterized protein
MSVEENKVIARRIFEEIWNQRNLDAMEEVCATGFVRHDPASSELSGPIGPEGFKQVITVYTTAFPDHRFVIDDMVAEGDMVVTRWTATGTHQGELMGIPPTGVKGTVTGITMTRFAHGKAVEEWSNWDTLGMMQQLGVIPR